MISFLFSQQDYAKSICNSTKAKNSYIYNLINHVYCQNLVESCEARKRNFELYEFISKFTKVDEGIYVALCGYYVYLVDVITGRIIKRKFKKLKNIEGHLEVSDSTVRLIVESKIIDIYNNSAIYNFGSWQEVGTNSEKGYRIMRVSRIGRFRIHTVIMALAYGFDIAKHLLCRYSLLTVEHKDKNEYNNAIDNLAIYTRSSNRKSASKDKNYIAFDFLELFEQIENEKENMHNKIIGGMLGKNIL